ncbi:hypothetical protein D3Z53_15230 [Lachnospiraceae bacterium]|jgi:hypothetical protein|nr:hypothetical protein [uncultured Schaedlerella sp.]MCI9154869.1 hypothetical protein [Ruminococcus sp.]NBI59383.1 hypothetical protein [Lachnospiraceae bacterium]
MGVFALLKDIKITASTRAERDFTKEYFAHKDQESREQILLLGGSGGYINSILPIAAVLSNYGFDVLALQLLYPYMLLISSLLFIFVIPSREAQ